VKAIDIQLISRSEAIEFQIPPHPTIPVPRNNIANEIQWNF